MKKNLIIIILTSTLACSSFAENKFFYTNTSDVINVPKPKQENAQKLASNTGKCNRIPEKKFYLETNIGTGFNVSGTERVVRPSVNVNNVEFSSMNNSLPYKTETRARVAVGIGAGYTINNLSVGLNLGYTESIYRKKVGKSKIRSSTITTSISGHLPLTSRISAHLDTEVGFGLNRLTSLDRLKNDNIKKLAYGVSGGVTLKVNNNTNFNTNYKCRNLGRLSPIAKDLILHVVSTGVVMYF